MRKGKLEDIPEWFDLSKYNRLDKCSLSEWASMFELRSGMIRAIEHYKVRRQVSDQFYDDWVQRCNVHINMISSNPLFMDEERRPFMHRVYAYYKKVGGAATSPIVQPISIENLKNLQNEFNEHIEQDEKLRKALEDDSYLDSADHDKLIYEHYDVYKSKFDSVYPYIANIEIDLNNTNENLIVQFEKCIDFLREENNIPQPIKKDKEPIKKFDESEMMKWIKYKLLPYMDISIYGFSIGVEYKHATLGDLLFDDCRDIDKAQLIGRETIPRARKIVTDYEDAIINQAINEDLEKV